MKDTTPKEKDRTTFFGRDGELGDIGVQKSKEKAPDMRDSSSSFGRGSVSGDISFKPDIPPQSIFRGKLHSRPTSSKSISSAAPAILATPPSPEIEAQHPAHLSPPGTVATTTITTTTTHYHLTGQTVQEQRQSFLPPLHLPQLNLTFDGASPFPPTNGLSLSAPELPYRSRDASTSSSKEDLDTVLNSSGSSRNVSNDFNKSDKRQLESIKPAPLFSGANNEKRATPPVSFYNSKHDLYDRVHLKHENARVSGETSQKMPDRQEHTAADKYHVQRQIPEGPSTKGGLSVAGAHSRSRSQDVWVRGSRRVDVEEVFKDIEATKSNGKARESRGSGFVVVGARDSFASSSNRSSKHEEIFAEMVRKMNTETEAVQNMQQEPPHHAPHQMNPPVPPSPKRETQFHTEHKGIDPLTHVEPGFVFPFAHAVTVDEPIPLSSASNPVIFRSQSSPLAVLSANVAIDNTPQPMPENPPQKGEIARPKTAPSTGTNINGYSQEPLGLGIRGADNGFVGGWKLDNIRRRNHDSITLPTPPVTLRTSSDASCGQNESPAIPRVGHSRKFSYRTIEGIALVEEGKLGNGKELTLADMVVESKGEQKQMTDSRQECIPFRPVTILETQKPVGQPRGSEDVVVLVDGTTLPVPAPVGSPPGKPKSKAESLHREPVAPVDKKKKGQKEEKRKGRRRWFGWKNKDAVADSSDRDSSGSGPGLSNASMSSKSSMGSSSSRRAAQQQVPPSTSSSDASMTPPGSSKSNQGSVLSSKGGSAQDNPKGIADFPYTSQRLAPVTAASLPTGPPPPRPPRPPVQQSTPANASSTTRGRAKSRESGLRYEVSGVSGPDNPGNCGKLETAITPGGKSPVLHHRHKSSSSLNHARNSSAPKPLGKLFVVCCGCEYWHDLPSQMYYEMHERGCSVKCVYCLHGMEVKCCSGYSCSVYVLEKHHGKI